MIIAMTKLFARIDYSFEKVIVRMIHRLEKVICKDRL